MSPDKPSPVETLVLSVSELTARIKASVERDFPDVCVMGEISRFTCATSGHLYMTIKDEGAVLGAAMWRNSAARLNFALQEGMEVIARGRIDVYPPRGNYQLILSELHPRGVGALQLAFRQLVDKLQKEGLFAPEHKVPLPRYPRRIGVVTSPTGAAVRDIIRVVRRRWPLAEVLLMPVRVQGRGAAEEIARAVITLNNKRPDLDLLIVGRGGGSLEDLWAFNEEEVARALYASRLPVISAVGHEVDVSVSDMVADMRAATPTEAAEKAVPDRGETERALRALARRMAALLASRAQAARSRLDALMRRPVLRRPEALVRDRAQRLDELLESMRRSMGHELELRGERLAGLGGRLEALSPLRVMERGYSITFGPKGDVLTSLRGLAEGEEIRTRTRGGEVRSTVLSVTLVGDSPDPEDEDASS